MIIVGAKGFAKELLQIFHDNNELENLFFFDDVSSDLPELLFDRFKVLQTLDNAKEIFQNLDGRYTLGVGNPKIRFSLTKKMDNIGGVLTSVISIHAKLGSYRVVLGKGVHIMAGTIITNDVKIGNGVLINLNCTIGHDSLIGNYCEFSPGVHISGHAQIGDYSSLGTGVVVIPSVSIGKNCIIGAGSVVNKDIPDNSVAVGVPAKVIKNVAPFNDGTIF